MYVQERYGVSLEEFDEARATPDTPESKEFVADVGKRDEARKEGVIERAMRELSNIGKVKAPEALPPAKEQSAAKGLRR